VDQHQPPVSGAAIQSLVQSLPHMMAIPLARLVLPFGCT
jgi:hypothetical protein